jgi:hypothetical protein
MTVHGHREVLGTESGLQGNGPLCGTKKSGGPSGPPEKINEWKLRLLRKQYVGLQGVGALTPDRAYALTEQAIATANANTVVVLIQTLGTSRTIDAQIDTAVVIGIGLENGIVAAGLHRSAQNGDTTIIGAAETARCAAVGRSASHQNVSESAFTLRKDPGNGIDHVVRLTVTSGVTTFGVENFLRTSVTACNQLSQKLVGEVTRELLELLALRSSVLVREISKVLVKVLQHQVNLLGVADGLRHVHLLTLTQDGGSGESRESDDNRDHDEKFHERETFTGPFFRFHSSIGLVFVCWSIAPGYDG